MRTWLRVGEIAARAKRAHPWTWPLRWWWGFLDAVLWSWWVMGGRELGVARFAWYRRLEDGWQRLYDAIYWPLLRLVAREIGE